MFPYVMLPRTLPLSFFLLSSYLFQLVSHFPFYPAFLFFIPSPFPFNFLSSFPSPPLLSFHFLFFPISSFHFALSLPFLSSSLILSFCNHHPLLISYLSIFSVSSFLVSYPFISHLLFLYHLPLPVSLLLSYLFYPPPSLFLFFGMSCCFVSTCSSCDG